MKKYLFCALISISAFFFTKLAVSDEKLLQENIFMTPYQYLLTLPFTPPAVKDIPKTPHGEMIRLGLDVFDNTPKYLNSYKGNVLRCSSCHLDSGRKAHAAPMWGAYPNYPAYRTKNNRINTITRRAQECFTYSLHGKSPESDSKMMTALVSYFAWLSTGAPTGVRLPGSGFLRLPPPPLKPTDERGKLVYKEPQKSPHIK